MATIKLDDNFSIEADANNFTLKFEQTNQKEVKGEMKDVTSKDEWHYPKMSQALDKYLNESVRPSESIKEVLETVLRVEKVIQTAAFQK